jgi:hypothetical protein
LIRIWVKYCTQGGTIVRELDGWWRWWWFNDDEYVYKSVCTEI